MSYLVYLTQKVSPFQCCRQPINTKKQLNLYQSQIQQPLKLNSFDKTQKIQQVIHVSDFYSSSELQNNFKVVEKSHFDSFLKNCQDKHQMFSDLQFETSQNVIKGIQPDKKIVWRRLSQIYNKSQYSVLNIDIHSQQSTTKPQQQIQFTPLKSSPFMSVLSLVKQKPKLIQQIFRTSQHQINNFGIYRLILNDHGYPKQIVIDDYVPVYMNTNQLVLSHAYMNQLWPIVLQKSIAKMLGTYSKLIAMRSYEILRLITPAPTVKYQLHSSSSSDSFQKHISVIKNAIYQQYLICCTSKNTQNKRIKPHHTYSIIQVENVRENQQPLIVLLDPLYQDDGVTQNESGISNKSSNSKHESYRQVFKLKYASFVKYFDQFSVCYFKHNFNMDFERMQITNRKAQYINLQIQQDSEIILTFSRVRRKFKHLPFINLSLVTNQIRKLTGIKGGWVKMLVAKQLFKNKQNTFEFVSGQIQTDDNTLSIHFQQLKSGHYTIYLEGYSQENDSEFYSFSAYGAKPFFIKSQKQPTIKSQYFLQDVMLNHCLSSQKDNKVTNNYFIQNDHDSWYVSHFLYKHGGFGYLVIYISKECKFNVQITIDVEKVRQQGYKLECKKVNKLYRKIIQPGNADVIVFSLNYQSKKDINRVQFPPKSIQVQIFQKVEK